MSLQGGALDYTRNSDVCSTQSACAIVSAEGATRVWYFPHFSCSFWQECVVHSVPFHPKKRDFDLSTLLASIFRDYQPEHHRCGRLSWDHIGPGYWACSLQLRLRQSSRDVLWPLTLFYEKLSKGPWREYVVV